jgi:DNA-binding NtrC family response regulator
MTVLDAAAFTHILIVADHPAQGLEAALAARGYRISRAAPDDLELAEQEFDHPDGAVIDVRATTRAMEALSQRLRVRNATLPVVILLAKGGHDRFAEPDGQTRIVGKPASAQDVIAQLEDLLFGMNRPGGPDR